MDLKHCRFITKIPKVTALLPLQIVMQCLLKDFMSGQFHSLCIFLLFFFFYTPSTAGNRVSNETTENGPLLLTMMAPLGR